MLVNQFELINNSISFNFNLGEKRKTKDFEATDSEKERVADKPNIKTV